MLLSVIIPIYNAESSLRHCLRSILKQIDEGVCQEFCVNRFNKQHRIAA